jgi:hypothetical protein
VALTGLPLLVLSILASLGAFGLTIWSWARGGRWRALTRTAGVLLCEALVLFTTGLVVNRSLDNLFPSWSALFNQDRAAPPPTVVADPTTKLDVWLHGRAVEGTHNGLVFEWHPGGAAAWHLPVPPIIYVPPRYFTATTARFPVVLVVASVKGGPAQAVWDPHKINLLVPRSDDALNPAVIVFLRTDHPDQTMLTRALPKVLDADLRTAARGWGVIGIGANAAVGVDALTEDPVRFWSAAVVSGLGELPKAVGRPRTFLDWQTMLTVVGGQPAGHPSAPPSPAPNVVNGGPAQTRVEVVAPPPERLPEALRWMYGRLPAPLTPPLTGPVDPKATPPSKKPGQ